jgi:hypothetical protein
MHARQVSLSLSICNFLVRLHLLARTQFRLISIDTIFLIVSTIIFEKVDVVYNCGSVVVVPYRSGSNFVSPRLSTWRCVELRWMASFSNSGKPFLFIPLCLFLFFLI